ncbi:MBL fold metallo-hydrolase [Actinacidiphila oryziradicis]|uniref:MBL fold metallo-hydrolase n=1 Tax=Actinacidiphila oryziradicis TaxID=2571141 RepID=UPI0023F0C5E0|nr:MBL fold metallo-hydrolase [Actinacidiphila oryziradicis]MCW2869558.1 beta-lactamase domain protein [Actinacidiphila oryziradicis]
METVQVTTDIWLLPFPVGQVYVIRQPGGYALVDSGPAGSEAAILTALRQLGARPHDLREIVLTHAHHDHCGSAAALAAATGARVLAGAEDAPAIRGTAPPTPPVLEPWERPLYDAVVPTVPHAPPARVDRELADGDELDWGAPARILHVPGHTPGSIALHLPSAGVLFTGDTIAHAQGQPMPGVFNTDRARTVDAYHRLAALDTETVCFGHGEPIASAAGEALRAAAI